MLAREQDELVIGASSTYSAEWLERRLKDRAAQVLSSLGGEPVSVRFVWDGAHQG
ncbi:MAG: hypothetical protein WKH64_11330 [Chloroflexia bacterium]